MVRRRDSNLPTANLHQRKPADLDALSVQREIWRIGITFLADNVRQPHGWVAVQAPIVATRCGLKAIRVQACRKQWIAHAGRDDTLDDVGIYALGIVQIVEFSFGRKRIRGEPIKELEITSTDKKSH